MHTSWFTKSSTALVLVVLLSNVSFVQAGNTAQPQPQYLPSENITRGEFVVNIMLNKYGRDAMVPGDCFTDVHANEWDSRHICKAHETGIISGYPDGSFGRTRLVTYAESMAMLQRVYEVNLDGMSFYEWPLSKAQAMNLVPMTVTDMNAPVTRGAMRQMKALIPALANPTPPTQTPGQTPGEPVSPPPPSPTPPPPPPANDGGTPPPPANGGDTPAPLPEPTPPPTPVTNVNSTLGTNLSEIQDYIPELSFIDLFKRSRPWVSGTRVVFSDGRALDLDEHDWVERLLPGQVAKTIIFAPTPNTTTTIEGYPRGDYIVKYDGEGELYYTGGAGVKNEAASQPGREVITVTNPLASLILNQSGTNAENPLRNIRIISPGVICDNDIFFYAPDAASCPNSQNATTLETLSETETFHPLFLKSLRPYKSIRFMHWMFSNLHQMNISWDDRPEVADARWSMLVGKGAPAEVMIDLANKLDADPWLSMHYLADEEYVRGFAAIVRDRLEPELKAYIEYSNEIWNGNYLQAGYCRDQGLALGLSSDPNQAQLRYYSQRSVEMFEDFEAVFGDASSDRLVRVLSGQAANPWTGRIIMDWRDAYRDADVYSVAPYFGNVTRGSTPQARIDAIARIAAMTPAELYAELETDIARVGGFISTNVQNATERGLKLVAYEGGQHMVQGNNASPGTINQTLHALFDTANRSAEIGELYETYLNLWKTNGGDLMMHHVNVNSYGVYSHFGARESLMPAGDSATKYQALVEFAQSNNE